MVDIRVNIGEAKDRFSQLIAAAKRGESVVILRAGKPEARIVPVEADTAIDHDARAARRTAFHGSFKGRIDTSLDWEAPSMSEADVLEWEARETARYRGQAV